MTLELSTEEEELLAELLDGAVRDLKMEIADTDSSTYKLHLRAREEVLLGLLRKVRQDATA
jgi:hypothetical protein